MGALRDIEFFLADDNSCGGLQVRTCPPTAAVGYYLVLTCFCGGFSVKWAMSEQALFNLVWPFQPYIQGLLPHTEGPPDCRRCDDQGGVQASRAQIPSGRRPESARRRSRSWRIRPLRGLRV